MSSPEAFRIYLSDEVLDDLRQRIMRSRWPSDLDNADWGYGVNADYLRDLSQQWAVEFDWRAVELEMNTFNHFRVCLDGQPIHFMRVPGIGPAPIPLILSHGWPSTFWDMRRVWGPLSDPQTYGGDPLDAFEIIIPSLPGFGFSTPLTQAGMNFWRTADLWNKLMINVLGFDSYAAAGADWGAMISSQIGHKYARSLVGIHIAHALPPSFFNHERPWDVTAGTLIPAHADADLRKAYTAFQRRFASHVAVQVIEPQTLAYGMHDSPIAQLAWLLQRWRTWGERGPNESCMPVGQMLTNATIYWATESFVSSARYYADVVRYPWSPSHNQLPLVQAPTGITFLGGDGLPNMTAQTQIKAFLSGQRARLFNVHYLKAHTAGGHFAHFENAPALIEDIRATFRELRHRH